MVPCGRPMVLGHDEDVVPQAGFEVAFHLRQVVERAGAAGDLFLGVVEEDQAEVERCRRRRAGHRPVTCFSSRCQPRGRICRVAILSFSLYSLPASFLNDSSRRMAL